MCLYPPCRVGHVGAELVLKAGELIRFKEFSVDVDALIELVHSLHFDLLHVFLTSDWNRGQVSIHIHIHS